MGRAEFLKRAGLQQPVQRNGPAIQQGADVDSGGNVSRPDPCPRCGEEVDWGGLPARKSLLAPLFRYGYYRRCPICEKENGDFSVPNVARYRLRYTPTKIAPADFLIP